MTQELRALHWKRTLVQFPVPPPTFVGTRAARGTRTYIHIDQMLTHIKSKSTRAEA